MNRWLIALAAVLAGLAVYAGAVWSALAWLEKQAHAVENAERDDEETE